MTPTADVERVSGTDSTRGTEDQVCRTAFRRFSDQACDVIEAGTVQARLIVLEEGAIEIATPSRSLVRSSAVLIGPRAAPAVVRWPARLVGVEIMVPAPGLMTAVPRLSDVGVIDLEVSACGGVDDVVSLALGRGSGAADPVLAMAWQRVTNLEVSTVGELVELSGWSHRHFLDRFSALYGLKPKLALRLARAGRAIEQLSQPDGGGLASIAHQAGYADQSHMNRDIQAFAGGTPTAVARRARSEPLAAAWYDGV